MNELLLGLLGVVAGAALLVLLDRMRPQSPAQVPERDSSKLLAALTEWMKVEREQHRQNVDRALLDARAGQELLRRRLANAELHNAQLSAVVNAYRGATHQDVPAPPVPFQPVQTEAPSRFPQDASAIVEDNAEGDGVSLLNGSARGVRAV